MRHRRSVLLFIIVIASICVLVYAFARDDIIIWQCSRSVWNSDNNASVSAKLLSRMGSKAKKQVIGLLRSKNVQIRSTMAESLWGNDDKDVVSELANLIPDPEVSEFTKTVIIAELARSGNAPAEYVRLWTNANTVEPGHLSDENDVDAALKTQQYVIEGVSSLAEYSPRVALQAEEVIRGASVSRYSSIRATARRIGNRLLLWASGQELSPTDFDPKTGQLTRLEGQAPEVSQQERVFLDWIKQHSEMEDKSRKAKFPRMQ